MSIYPKVLPERQNGKVSAKGKSTALASREIDQTQAQLYLEWKLLGTGKVYHRRMPKTNSS